MLGHVRGAFTDAKPDRIGRFELADGGTLFLLELAGPFTDNSGGAYLLHAADLEEAQFLAFSDPVHTTNSSLVTVREWNAK